jgi:hypothetical protein
MPDASCAYRAILDAGDQPLVAEVTHDPERMAAELVGH